MHQPQTIEAVFRCPAGDVRVWIDAEDDTRAVRYSVRLDYAGELAQQQGDIVAVAEGLADAIKVLAREQSTAVARNGLFREWLVARIIPDRGARALVGDLYQDFCQFVLVRDGRPMSARAFGDALRERGYPLAGKDSSGLKFRGGLRLRSPDEMPAPALRKVG